MTSQETARVLGVGVTALLRRKGTLFPGMPRQGRRLVILSVLALLAASMPLLLVIGLVRTVRRRRRGDPIMASVIMTVIGALGSSFGALFAWGATHPDLGPLVKGRLMRLGGSPRIARRKRGTGWSDGEQPDLHGLAAHERSVLGTVWHFSAGLEHASVAAFGRLADRLISLGAPADLIERCHLAALDEIRHAKRCFALASSYSGVAWTAGEFPELRKSWRRGRRCGQRSA